MVMGLDIMSDVFNIIFDNLKRYEDVFDRMSREPNVDKISDGILQIHDPTSNSKNFIESKNNLLMVELEVRTPFMVEFILTKLKGYPCMVKDPEDDINEPGVSIVSFFRVNISP